MRIRSIKPEFWRSDDITALGWEDRLIFIGLWSYVDDNGVGLDKLASITADLFAGDIENDSSETFARVSRGLQNLSEAGRIVRYSIDGKKFLYITNWDKHQRIDKPNKARYPEPTPENTGILVEFATPSGDPRETPATGTEEQGNRGIKDLSKPAALDDKRAAAEQANREFEQWYSAYPRKEAKENGRKAFLKARKTVDLETLVATLAKYTASIQGKDRQHIALPASWLNAGRWQDEYEEPKRVNAWSKEFHS